MIKALDRRDEKKEEEDSPALRNVWMQQYNDS